MNWHARYLQQAKWTRGLRAYLFEKAGLISAQRILEVGCGTGAVLRELKTPASLHGLDLDSAALDQCRINALGTFLVHGNGLSLPYPNQTFDIVYCHYFLLWVQNPLQAVYEMKRVTRKNGHILALAEPDYSSRIDRPDELKIVGIWQSESLERQGAEPAFGMHLAETFYQAGINILETGTIQSVRNEPSPEEQELEWDVIESDLAETVSKDEIQKMKLLDKQAWERGERVLNVPTYFAWGQI